MIKMFYILLIAVLLFSCERRELTYDYMNCGVTVNVDWSTLEQKQGEAPSGMTVIFYPNQGGDAIVKQTNNISQTSVSLRAGKYNILIFNQIESDFGSLGFKGMDRFETAEVFARTTNSNWYKSKAPNEVVVRHPEYLGVATQLDFEMTDELVDAAMKLRSKGSKSTSLVAVDFKPEVVVSNIKTKVKVIGIHNLRNTRATIKGMSTGYDFSACESCSNMVTHVLDEWSVTTYDGGNTEGEIDAIFTSFGPPERHIGTRSENDWMGSIYFELLLVDNKTVEKRELFFNEHLITNTNNEHNIDMLIKLGLSTEADDKPITLPDVDPEVPEGDGDLDVDLGDWGDEDIIDIPL